MSILSVGVGIFICEISLLHSKASFWQLPVTLNRMHGFENTLIEINKRLTARINNISGILKLWCCYSLWWCSVDYKMWQMFLTKQFHTLLSFNGCSNSRSKGTNRQPAVLNFWSFNTGSSVKNPTSCRQKLFLLLENCEQSSVKYI